jgi:hypothetical protein
MPGLFEIASCLAFVLCGGTSTDFKPSIGGKRAPSEPQKEKAYIAKHYEIGIHSFVRGKPSVIPTLGVRVNELF